MDNLVDGNIMPQKKENTNFWRSPSINDVIGWIISILFSILF